MTTIAPQDKHHHLDNKLLDLAFEKVGFSAVSAILLAALIVVAMWSIIEHERLLAWLGMMTLIQALSFFQARRYMRLRHGVGFAPGKWREGLIAGGAVAGLCWGSTVFSFPVTPFNPETMLGMFVLPSTPFDPVTVLLMFILAGVTAYASVAMAFVPAFAIVFLACTLLPLSIWLLSFGEHMYVVMGLIALSYLGVMVMLSRRMYSTMCNLIAVSEENNVLRQDQQENNLRMQQFFESAPGFFYTACLSQDGKSSMPFASAGIHELFEVTAGDVEKSMTALFARVHADDIARLLAARETSRSHLAPFHIEFRIKHSCKGERWVELNSLPQRDSDGTTRWHGFMQEITIRKQMEESLAVSEREFRTLAENAPDPIYRYDRDCRRVYVNPAVAKLTGVPLEKMLGKSPNEFVPVPTVDSDKAQRCIQRVLDTGMAGELEVSFRSVNGHDVVIHNNFVPEFDSAGNVASVLAIGRDITAHKRMEAVLHRSEVEFRTLAENLPVAVIRYDAEQRRSYLNPAAERMLHGSAAELIGNVPGGPMVPATPAMIEHYRGKMETVLASGGACEFEFVLDALHVAEREYYEVRFTPELGVDGKPSGVLAIWFDITERKRMEAILVEREREFRSLAGNMPDNVARWDLEGRYLYLNSVHEHTLGIAASEIIGRADYETHAAVMASIEQVVASGHALTFKRLPMLVDGVTQLHDVTMVPEREADGRIVSVLGLGRDMSEIYRLQDELAVREQEFRSLAESSPDSIIRYDLDHRILYLNTPWLNDFGLSSTSEVIGKRPIDIWPDGRFAELDAAIERVMIGGEAEIMELVRGTEAAGQLKVGLVSVVPERNAAGEIIGALEFGRDITAIRETEHRLNSLVENLPGIAYTFRLSPQGEPSFPYVSAGVEAIYGISPEVAVSDFTAIHNLAHPDDRPRIEAGIAESARTLMPYRVESRVCRMGHTERWLDVRAVPHAQPDGSILWSGIMLDITTGKLVQKQLELLDRAIDMSADSVFLMNEQLRFVYVNETACRALGYSREELLTMDVCDIDPDTPREVIVKIIKESPLGVPAAVEARHRAKDGRTYPVEISGVQFEEGGARFALTVARDISERKQYEKSLSESRNFLNRIIDGIPDPIFVKDKEHRWVLGNEAFCKLIGQPREKFIGKSDYDFLPREQADIFWDKDELVFNSGETNVNEEAITGGDGDTRYLHTKKTPFVSADGQALLVGVIRDITERKQAELALRASEEQAKSRSNLLNAIVDSSPDVIVFALDTQYRYLSFNRKHKEVIQAIWGREIAAGMSMLEVIGAHPDREAAKRGFDRALSGESFVLEEAYGDELLSRQYWMNYWSPIRAETGDVVGLTCFVMNVTERRRIEEAMRANQEKLSTLFALSPLGIALTDMQGRYVEFNEAFRAICGYPTDELMMLDYWTLTPKKYETQEAQQLESLAKTGRYGPYEKEYRQKNGMLIPIQLNGMLVTGKDGQQYIWSIVEDIRERKKSEAVLKERFQRIAELNQHLEQNARDLEEQAVELEMSKEQLQQTEAWYRSILHSAPDGMLIVDSRGYIMQVNAQLEAMFGYEGGELPGCHIEVLLPQSVRASHVDKRSAFISSGQRDRRMAGAAQDLFGCRKDGSEFPVDVSLSRLPDLDGRVGTICAAVRDVTERQKADVARESALSEALRLAQLRSSFLAQMSHELRTPLNGILGYTQNLLRGEALGEDQRSGLNIIQHSGEHLLTLINGILDHAAIEAGKFELVPGDIELEAFLTTLIGIIRVRAEQKSIAFSCEAGDDLPAIVRGDAQRLRQVLLNLLSNAVKFTDKGQVILRVTYPAPSRLRFEVQDSGVGIAADQLDSIFLPFEQVGETSRRAGGNGLGLAISRKLVDLMGGSIHVESHLGAGSVFSFEIEMVAVESDAAKVNAAVLSERAATRNSPLASLLFAPPAQELDVLYALALRGNMRDIARQATHLSELDSRYGPFAEHLRQLAKGFQTKALLGFIAQYRNAKE